MVLLYRNQFVILSGSLTSINSLIAGLKSSFYTLVPMNYLTVQISRSMIYAGQILH